jgi:hypothetical protein
VSPQNQALGARFTRGFSAYQKGKHAAGFNRDVGELGGLVRGMERFSWRALLLMYPHLFGETVASVLFGLPETTSRLSCALSA